MITFSELISNIDELNSEHFDSSIESNLNDQTDTSNACQEEVIKLLLDNGANIEHKSKTGLTPLMCAALLGLNKIVEILLNYNANIEAQSTVTLDTPLLLACSMGRYEVRNYFLK